VPPAISGWLSCVGDVVNGLTLRVRLCTDHGAKGLVMAIPWM
jgi:hypothetical protein